MAVKQRFSLTWLVAVMVVAIMMVENVKKCSGSEMVDSSEEKHENGWVHHKAKKLSEMVDSSEEKHENGWVHNKAKKLSEMVDSSEEKHENGWVHKKKLSNSKKVDTEGMKEGAQNMMDGAKDSASDASNYVSDKAPGVFDWMTKKVGEAYGSTKEKASELGEKLKGN